MDILCRMREGFGHKDGVKRIKVSVGSLKENASRIQAAMADTQDEINRISEKMAQIDRKTEDGEKEYADLQEELKEKHEMYSLMQTELKMELENIKKFREGKHAIAPKDAFMIGGVVFLATFMIALERENPKALKLATFLLKLVPLHL